MATLGILWAAWASGLAARHRKVTARVPAVAWTPLPLAAATALPGPPARINVMLAPRLTIAPSYVLHDRTDGAPGRSGLPPRIADRRQAPPLEHLAVSSATGVPPVHVPPPTVHAPARPGHALLTTPGAPAPPPSSLVRGHAAMLAPAVRHARAEAWVRPVLPASRPLAAPGRAGPSPAERPAPQAFPVAASPPAPAAPAPVALPEPEIARLTDQVIRRMDQRAVARRERLGRG